MKASLPPANVSNIMIIPLRLAQHARYEIRLYPRLGGADHFGWAYLICNAGGGRLEIADGAFDQPEDAKPSVSAQGLVATALRANAGRAVHLTVVADANGFQGEFALELLSAPDSRINQGTVLAFERSSHAGHGIEDPLLG